MHPRSSKRNFTEPRLLNPSNNERTWIRTIPDTYPDILRAPAVSYKPERDDPRIKANQYVTFARPYRGKQGLLIIGQQQRPIIIDETQPDKANVLPMRLDRESLQGTWAFSISLYEAEGLIQLEDCIIANGQQIRSTKPFKDRFALLQRFVDSIWYQDKDFQLNWQIQLAEVFSLESIKAAIEKLAGGYLCLMPNVPSLRLLKVVLRVDEPKVVIKGGPQEFICKAIPGKPDVYDLFTIEGKARGRASIQTLSISQALQHKVATGEPMRVLAEWNTDFESYIVSSVL
jgi:hypothetical protein